MELPYAQLRTILRCTVGSRALGVSTEDSDHDEMGVMVEEIKDVVRLGVGEGFQQFTFRTAVKRTGKVNARSEKGDVDLKLYSLRKFCGLACDGNPDVLAMLFIKPSEATTSGRRLQKLADKFVSKLAVSRYLGYMQGQRSSMWGGLKKLDRETLSDAYGFDTKFAMHYIRLGEQCVELLEDGCLTFPMPEPARGRLLAIRRGMWHQKEIIEHGEGLIAKIKDLEKKSILRDLPDREYLERWMQDTYEYAWKWGQRV